MRQLIQDMVTKGFFHEESNSEEKKLDNDDGEDVEMKDHEKAKASDKCIFGVKPFPRKYLTDLCHPFASDEEPL